MIKGIIGLIILGVLLVIWVVRKLLQTGRVVYDATIGQNPYISGVREASMKLGVNPDSVVNDPKFLELIRRAQGIMNSHEFALYNAIGIHLKQQIRDPKPYPNDLHLSIATAMEWADSGYVRRDMLADLLANVKRELTANGQNF